VGSDAFDSITLDRMHKAMLKGYKEWTPQWPRLISSQKSVSDFRTYYGIISGGFDRLPEVKEKGAYLEKAFDDDTISYSPAKRGALYGVSFEAQTYDDLGLLDSKIAKLGNAAARTYEYFFFYTCLDANPTSYDGSNNVFGTVGSTPGTFANTMTTNGLTTANLETAYETMLAQTALGSDSTFTDDGYVPVQYIPKYLLVHTSDVLTAKRILQSSGVAENANNGDNVLQGELEIISTPYITSTHWYLMADPGMGANTMEAGLWHGSAEPEFFYEAADSGRHFAFDELRTKVRTIFGGTLLDPRAWVLGSST